MPRVNPPRRMRRSAPYQTPNQARRQSTPASSSPCTRRWLIWPFPGLAHFRAQYLRWKPTPKTHIASPSSSHAPSATSKKAGPTSSHSPSSTPKGTPPASPDSYAIATMKVALSGYEHDLHKDARHNASFELAVVESVEQVDSAEIGSGPEPATPEGSGQGADAKPADKDWLADMVFDGDVIHVNTGRTKSSWTNTFA